MIRLLDTNVCIAFLNGVDRPVRDRFLGESPDDLRLCSVVKAELLYGARHSAKVADNLQKLERFFAPFESLPFDDAAAEWYGTIRAQLKRDARPIGGNDLLIAAIAGANDLTLVTRNDAEFRQVTGLRVEVW